jgi:hypothetical protein
MTVKTHECKVANEDDVFCDTCLEHRSRALDAISNLLAGQTVQFGLDVLACSLANIAS